MENYKATGMSRCKIRAITNRLREYLMIKANDKVPILKVLEYIAIVLDYELDIVYDDELPYKYAEIYPSEKIIRIRESVYNNAYNGDARSRFTIAHEIGHLFLHENNRISFARTSSTKMKPYESPEWQANVFAAEFLVPVSNIKNLTPNEIATKYNVSKKVAQIQSTFA